MSSPKFGVPGVTHMSARATPRNAASPATRNRTGGRKVRPARPPALAHGGAGVLVAVVIAAAEGEEGLIGEDRRGSDPVFDRHPLDALRRGNVCPPRGGRSGLGRFPQCRWVDSCRHWPRRCLIRRTAKVVSVRGRAGAWFDTPVRHPPRTRCGSPTPPSSRGGGTPPSRRDKNG